jgi:hypothetical protein
MGGENVAAIGIAGTVHPNVPEFIAEPADFFRDKNQEILANEGRMLYKKQRYLAITVPQSFQANERECMPWQI